MPEASRIIPNTFQCPNALVDDEIMSVLSGNETKCFVVLVRKTFGWHKAADRIAKSQIMKATGLGEAAVDASVEALVEFGLVLRLAENNPNENFGVLWGLQTDDGQIAWDKLRERAEKAAKKKVKQTQKARETARGGVVQQPQVVEQPDGGVVQQPPQKPLSKGSTATTTGAEITEVKPATSPAATPKTETTARPNIFKLYEENIGLLTPLLADKLRDAEKEYLEPWIEYAFAEAVAHNKRSWDYIDAILRRIKTEGFENDHKLSASRSKPATRSRRPSNGAQGSPGGGGENPARRAAIEKLNQRRRSVENSGADAGRPAG